MPSQQSYLSWYLNALGVENAAWLSLSTFVSCVLILWLAFRGKGIHAALAMILLIPVPLIIGVYAGLDGAISAMVVISRGATQPTGSQFASGLAMTFVAPWLGMLLCIPNYLVALLSMLVRSQLLSYSANRESPV